MSENIKKTLYLCFCVKYSQLTDILICAAAIFDFPTLRASREKFRLVLYLKSVSTP